VHSAECTVAMRVECRSVSYSGVFLCEFRVSALVLDEVDLFAVPLQVQHTLLLALLLIGQISQPHAQGCAVAVRIGAETRADERLQFSTADAARRGGRIGVTLQTHSAHRQQHSNSRATAAMRSAHRSTLHCSLVDARRAGTYRAGSAESVMLGSGNR
jgi:hypothetical protein